jgi:hypothetical protein
LPIRFSELANTPHSPKANALAGQWQGQCIRLWQRLGFADFKAKANGKCIRLSFAIGECGALPFR